MADAAALAGLAARAEAALAARDWMEFGLLDSRLLVYLQQRQGAFTTAERQQLQRLTRLWQRAYAEAGGECDRLKGILDDIGQHGEARTAYALVDSWND